MKARIFISAVFLFFAAGCFNFLTAGVRYVPVADISVSAGGVSRAGGSPSYGADSAVYFTPAIVFGSESSFLPIVSFRYSGFRHLRELAGGDVLFRESAEGGINLVYKTSLYGADARLRAAYRENFINEAKDEDWSEGLFDHRRFLLGAEAGGEILGYDFSFSADYLEVKFPNYESLVKDFEGAFDSEPLKELSREAGGNVLDYSELVLGLSASPEKTAARQLGYSYSLGIRDYSDQRKVESDGSFSSDKRRDVLNSLGADLRLPRGRFLFGVSGEASYLSSNQNLYEAPAAEFIEDYYSWIEGALGVSASYYTSEDPGSLLKMKWETRLRSYIIREARDEKGNYTGDNHIREESSITLSWRHRLFEGFYSLISLKGSFNSSNTEYEGNYVYNFETFNYSMGLNWRY